MRKLGSFCAKLIGAQPMGSGALQIKVPSPLGLIGSRAECCLCLWNFRKCSAPVLADYICGQQRQTGLWRWNTLFLNALPSWSSVASACYRFPLQVRGLLHQTPASVNSKKDWDRPWSFRAVLEGIKLNPLTYPHFHPFEMSSHLSPTFKRVWTELDAAAFYQRRQLTLVKLSLNNSWLRAVPKMCH